MTEQTTTHIYVKTYEGLYKQLEKLYNDKEVKNVKVYHTGDGGYNIVYSRNETQSPKAPSVLIPDYYQLCARRTQNENLNTVEKRSHALFGLCSEAGEIHSLFQHEYQGKPIEKEKVIDECGDLCWFMCELLDTYNIDFSEVLKYNIAKLQKRYPEGFDAVRSEQRHEKE